MYRWLNEINKGFRIIIGDDQNCRFLEDNWTGGRGQKLPFSRIYAFARMKSEPVINFGIWEEGRWSWDARLRRRVFN